MHRFASKVRGFWVWLLPGNNCLFALRTAARTLHGSPAECFRFITIRIKNHGKTGMPDVLHNARSYPKPSAGKARITNSQLFSQRRIHGYCPYPDRFHVGAENRFVFRARISKVPAYNPFGPDGRRVNGQHHVMKEDCFTLTFHSMPLAPVIHVGYRYL